MIKNNNRTKKIWVICILFILFVSPFFLARWFFHDYGTEVVSTLGTVNEGELLQPPIKLAIRKSEKVKSGSAKWTIVCVASDKVKPVDIESTLDKIQRIRLSLGKEFSGTSALLILRHSEEIKMPAIAPESIPIIILPESKITELLAFSGGKQGIFIMDPENQVVLAYAADVNSEAIYKDIRRLLKYKQGA